MFFRSQDIELFVQFICSFMSYSLPSVSDTSCRHTQIANTLLFKVKQRN